MSDIAQLAPQALWQQFARLCEIPRPSKHEDKVVKAIIEFATNRGLHVQQDKIGNVILKKPATPGMEDRAPLAMQSHVDMVPQKNADTEHDFINDPIRPYIDGDWVTAEGTTLGADNGIGVAAILALLDSRDIPHGPLEALLTIDEEAGMTGASNLEPGYFDADLLLNLDTEDEGELYVGCAGGVDVNVSLPYQPEPVPAGHIALQLAVRGLLGGHSGVDIHLERGNANKIANRIIACALEKAPSLRIAALNGGSLRNAIPRESFTTLVLAEADKPAFETAFNDCVQEVAAELGNEPNLSVTLEAADRPATMLDAGAQAALIRALRVCPNGVARMSLALEGIVETSNNMAIVKTSDDAVQVQCLVRSLSNSARDEHAQSIAELFRLAGGEASIDNSYPGWTPNMDSPLLAMMKDTFQKLYGNEPAVKVIHAGLECGLLGHVYPNWDMVSFGPTIRRAHSPDEKVHIESVGKFWEYFIAVVGAVPRAS
ncbi:aminoacyl-histidine dipeptidase [Biformimicrobium ophioploci]|uniref:Aminoacyl-histidine dipeptidase n=1 Tax=Biformimicrobium ophioploci TaxID=3036711 RepID=A0ABQ6M2F2_9GAMM|nr:aminoacyl-histidine dipeptidase [Microbulbifer sp. NKW57]GMG88515.1 aminoacyl-histidine dipeptidase [Microbulbifer sp. NKW57]